MPTQAVVEFQLSEIDRLYSIVAVFEPVVRYYLSSYESSNEDDVEPEAVAFVRRALAALEQGVTIEQIEQEEEEDGDTPSIS